MKNYFWFLLICSIIFINCTSNSSSPENLNLPPGTHNRHEVSFIGGNIPLPNKYKEVSYVELENELQKILTGSTKFSHYYNLVNELEDNGNYILFADTTNFSNYIIMTLGEYVNFDKQTSAMYLNVFEDNLYAQYQKQNTPVEKLTNIYITAGSSKILKMRYLVGGYFYNQYIITSRGKTFVFVAWNNDPLGFDTEIKGLRLE